MSPSGAARKHPLVSLPRYPPLVASQFPSHRDSASQAKGIMPLKAPPVACSAADNTTPTSRPAASTTGPPEVLHSTRASTSRKT
jgi:hypothetical protein